MRIPKSSNLTNRVYNGSVSTNIPFDFKKINNQRFNKMKALLMHKVNTCGSQQSNNSFNSDDDSR